MEDQNLINTCQIFTFFFDNTINIDSFTHMMVAGNGKEKIAIGQEK